MNATKPRPSEEEMWAGPSGQRWLASSVRFEETLRPIGDELIERAGLTPGEHVVDVGCGTGSTCFDIAGRVTPGGSVIGLDISPEMVNEGTRRVAVNQPKATVRFVCADAARNGLPPGRADVLISRFGTMFFTNPYAAFGHLHGLLRPGGRLALACWQPMKLNPWMLEMRSIVGAHFDLPVIPPRTPGPFAFDDPAYLRDVLTQTQFEDIDIEPWQTQMFVGGPRSGPESAADFMLQALSIAQRVADAPEAVQKQVRAELVDHLKAYLTPEGVRMTGAVWFATARA
jgi:SAM-dependent methyltransferase